MDTDDHMNNSGQNLKSGGRLRAAELCLGLLCFILLAVILALVAHNNSAISSWSEYQMKPTEKGNLTSIVMELQARVNNLTELKKGGKTGPCPLRWVEVNRECLYVSPRGVSKSWSSSKKDCADRGGRLVTVKTRLKLEALSLFNSYSWIGLSDSGTEGSWMWEDGTDLDTPFWNKGEPNDHNENEDCAHIAVESGTVGFNDNNCGKTFSYICEASG